MIRHSLTSVHCRAPLILGAVSPYSKRCLLQKLQVWTILASSVLQKRSSHRQHRLASHHMCSLDYRCISFNVDAAAFFHGDGGLFRLFSLGLSSCGSAVLCPGGWLHQKAEYHEEFRNVFEEEMTAFLKEEDCSQADFAAVLTRAYTERAPQAESESCAL